MKSVCCMHPTKAAHWLCPKCKQMYCSDCIVKLSGGAISSKKIVRFCPKCTVETQWIGGTDVIKPFWERLPRFFIYPLSLGPMIYMAVLALGSLLSWIPMINFVCWSAMMSYSYVALKRTAGGNLAPPPIWDEAITKDFNLVFKQIVLFIVLFFLFLMIGQHLGPLFAILFGVLALFLLPSMIIILVNTQSVKNALNPSAFLALPFAIGKGYFIMFLFLTFFLFAPAELLKLIAPMIPKYLYQYVFSFAENYYTLISYHLMGYVLLQYHKEIGYDIDVDDIKDDKNQVKETADDPATLELKKIEVICREGKLDEAIDHIKQWRQNGGPLNLRLAERYYDLLKNRQQTQEMINHAPAYLGLVIESGNKNKALEVYQACCSVDPAFTPEPKTLFKIGEWLADSGKPKDAIKVLSSLTKTYPEAADVPMAYFRAAQLYNDRLMDGNRAKTILEQIIQKYPDHKMIQRFKTYLEHIR